MGYWPRGYFGRGAGGVPPTDPGTADDLFGAILALFEATDALTSTITGGLYLAEAPRVTPTGPYCVTEESSVGTDWHSATSTVQDTRLKFKVYGDDINTNAGPYGDALIEAFRGRAFAWAGGRSNALLLKGRRHEKETEWARGAVEVWCLAVAFQCRVKRDN